MGREGCSPLSRHSDSTYVWNEGDSWLFSPTSRSSHCVLLPQVRIAKQLTLDRTIKPENIVILSPYNAQVSEINKRLTQEGVRRVTVCTIMKSQGEVRRKWQSSLFQLPAGVK